jgi:hypothetical protein
MTTLAEIFKADSITAAWFWVDSLSVGPYAEEEKFDAVFVRETNGVVGGGYIQRRTLHVQGIVTHRSMSRRENGGRIVRPDALAVLADVISNAHVAGQYISFPEWADDQRGLRQGYRDALADFEEWEVQRARHRQLVAWLGDDYDTYVKAAEEYCADH